MALELRSGRRKKGASSSSGEVVASSSPMEESAEARRGLAKGELVTSKKSNERFRPFEIRNFSYLLRGRTVWEE